MKNIFENKSIENLINGTMENLHTLVEANTIVGDKIFTPDGGVIIPISKVSVGYVVGGGEYIDVARKKKFETFPLAGGSGGGVTVTPVGFLISSAGTIEYIDIENKTAFENALKIINKIASKFAKEG
ncbi:MAG: sporulation protein YtfJ [Clostridia bacterium]|nr:sporulation protein YtfJ [Clostridia bacterium]